MRGAWGKTESNFVYILSRRLAIRTFIKGPFNFYKLYFEEDKRQ